MRPVRNIGGTLSRQTAIAEGQRGAKRQPAPTQRRALGRRGLPAFPRRSGSG